ncbi:MAG: hypothetical protein CVU31_02710 [Betaproteobacteria bacterium HGW-Betaproteobacteria-4]|nr:MAG: hypothetical protein CVU31_02710 [Betaproteobacteria bacterium HGW-Betaproteobacteria-4]
MSSFLTTAEIADLTDRQLPSKQIAWLAENRWKFAVSAAGRPKVARSFYDFMLGTATKEPDEQQEPDFSGWVNKHGGATEKQSGTRHEPALRLRGKTDDDLLHNRPPQQIHQPRQGPSLSQKTAARAGR